MDFGVSDLFLRLFCLVFGLRCWFLDLQVLRVWPGVVSVCWFACVWLVLDFDFDYFCFVSLDLLAGECWCLTVCFCCFCLVRLFCCGLVCWFRVLVFGLGFGVAVVCDCCFSF